MDELSRDLNSLLDPAHCTNSSFGLFIDQPPENQAEAYTPSSITPKRKRVEEASSKGKALLCFFPNTTETSGLMELAGYRPKYEMVVPVTVINV